MSRKPILLVEDDEDIRENLKEILESENYSVWVAKNGQEALDLLVRDRRRPGIVLLDFMMPVMDGQTFLSELEKVRVEQLELQTLPVFILTAANYAQDPRATGFIRKPLELDDLLKVVELHCG